MAICTFVSPCLNYCKAAHQDPILLIGHPSSHVTKIASDQIKDLVQNPLHL